ncbi:MAG: hypothetical protein HYU29_07360 [Chloroflexi bacterium]|nr:hypothetical protein [Chloroflexota bacterium]
MAELRELRDKTAIVGVGNTDFGALCRNLDPERSLYDLGMTALKMALDDAGLTKSDVDGVIVSRIPDYTRFCDMHVEVVFDDVTPEITLPRFKPLDR